MGARRNLFSTAMASGLVVLAGCTAAPAGHATTHRSPSTPSARPGATTNAARRTTRVQAVREPWRLPYALSREVVFAAGGDLVVAGGLTASGTVARVFRLNPATGRIQPDGRLAEATHDAAGATVAGQMLVFGGGSTVSITTVQSLFTGRRAAVVARLPRRRSDLAAAVVGGTAYLVGGYDGARYDASVLATADGRSLRRVAELPVPVRYPAVAALGGVVYVFGGERPGGATSVIQRVDPRARAAAVIGHLRRPLAHAAAVIVGGTIFLAGGVGRSGYSRQIWRFQPRRRGSRDQEVVPAGRLPYAVSDAGAATIGDSAYLIGGEHPGPVVTAIKLRPARMP